MDQLIGGISVDAVFGERIFGDIYGTTITRRVGRDDEFISISVPFADNALVARSREDFIRIHVLKLVYVIIATPRNST